MRYHWLLTRTKHQLLFFGYNNRLISTKHKFFAWCRQRLRHRSIKTTTVSNNSFARIHICIWRWSAVHHCVLGCLFKNWYWRLIHNDESITLVGISTMNLERSRWMVFHSKPLSRDILRFFVKLTESPWMCLTVNHVLTKAAMVTPINKCAFCAMRNVLTVLVLLVEHQVRTFCRWEIITFLLGFVAVFKKLWANWHHWYFTW